MGVRLTGIRGTAPLFLQVKHTKVAYSEPGGGRRHRRLASGRKGGQAGGIVLLIASIHFRSYRVLGRTTLPLGRFNLILGPNGSGKSTAVNALLALRGLVADRDGAGAGMTPPRPGEACEAHLAVAFSNPFSEYSASVDCVQGERWGALAFSRDGQPTRAVPEALLKALAGVRRLALDAAALSRPCPDLSGWTMEADGTGFPAILGRLSVENPDRWAELVEAFSQLMPEFAALTPRRSDEGVWSFTATTADGLELAAGDLSQGTLVALALHALAFLPKRPSLLCLEELERGIHPRLLREIRDSLYRLCYPEDHGDEAEPVQIVATTHSPYLLDLFSDHPEEVVLTVKEGTKATFQRLIDLPDLDEMLETGNLGDLWYSGVIGGVPY